MNAPPSAGQLWRVIRVDLVDQTIHVQTPDGRVGRWTGATNIESLSVGSVILVVDDRWEPAPDDLWQDLLDIGTVRRVFEDGTVIVESGLGFRRVKNNSPDELSDGNMVEYNLALGIVGRVTERPIRTGLLRDDPEDPAAEYLLKLEDTAPDFADFGGYPEVVARAKELVETQLARRAMIERIGARPVKGVLFTGAPGTGKTHLARILAKASDADFYLISGPTIVSKWLGDTEGTLRKIFEAASASDRGRAIIFFDEIDSIAERRTSDSHEASRRLVAQLLTLMDRVNDTDTSVVVIAATNRLEALDPALTRPGRFDWSIDFGLPTLTDRLEILQVSSKHLVKDSELPLEDIATFTGGWSAADLTAIWTDAAILAAGEDRESIAVEDLVQAYERVRSRAAATSPGWSDQ